MRIPRRVASLLPCVMTCALILTACGGDANPSGSPSPGAGGDEDPVSARVAEVLAMSADDQEAVLADAGLDVQVAVAEASGLTEELGGPEQTRAALVEAWAPTIATARGVGDADPAPEQATPAAYIRSAADEPSLGEGLFGGLLISGLGSGVAADAAQDQKAGEPASETRGDITVSGTVNRGEIALDSEHTSSDGVTTRLQTKASVVPCPDADGRFEAQQTMDVSVRKGTVGYRGTLEVTVVGYVDDNADLASSTTDFSMEWRSTAAAGGELVRVEGSYGDGALEAVSSTVEGKGYELNASLYAGLIETFLVRAARDAWQSGKCVRLDAVASPAGRMVEPRQVVQITASPRSTMDGSKTGGTVTGSLTGGQSLDPEGSNVPADASFTYTAPSATKERAESGKVALEARSKRGVGKATLEFVVDPVSYIASGSGPEITFSGKVRSPDTIFTVQAKFVGGTAEFEFSSDIDDEGFRVPKGVVTITGGGSGAKVTGTGTYTIAENDDGSYTVTAKVRACVDVSGVCRDATHVITLTPTS